jgi:hypothetical protein
MYKDSLKAGTPLILKIEEPRPFLNSNPYLSNRYLGLFSYRSGFSTLFSVADLPSHT